MVRFKIPKPRKGTMGIGATRKYPKPVTQTRRLKLVPKK